MRFTKVEKMLLNSNTEHWKDKNAVPMLTWEQWLQMMGFTKDENKEDAFIKPTYNGTFLYVERVNKSTYWKVSLLSKDKKEITTVDKTLYVDEILFSIMNSAEYRDNQGNK
jgi:hypothetical protein